ncbi:MAG: hypothetical protein COA91_04195 [Robiginitomaculum sp.]|nr:MAG: hypothetical protein COA91_04195 [Robiginitomaculum sp.]
MSHDWFLSSLTVKSAKNSASLLVTPDLTRGLVLSANGEVPALHRKSGLSGMTKREVIISYKNHS